MIFRLLFLLTIVIVRTLTGLIGFCKKIDGSLVFSSDPYVLNIKCLMHSESLNTTIGGWVVDGVVATAAFLAFHSLAHDDVAGVNHVAEFANVHVDLRAEEEFLGLFVEDV